MTRSRSTVLRVLNGKSFRTGAIAAGVVLAVTALSAQQPDFLFQETPATQPQPAEVPPGTDPSNIVPPSTDLSNTVPPMDETLPTAPIEEPAAPSDIETPPSATAPADETNAEPGTEEMEPEVNPDAAVALQEAQVAASQGNLTEALAKLDEAISLQPDFLEAFLFRNLVQRLAGNYEEAVRAASQAIAINPNTSDGYLNRALAYLEMKEYANVLADVDAALKVQPNNPQAYMVAAIVHERRKDWEKTVDAYTKAIENAAAAPNVLGNALLQRGIAFFHLGEYEVAKLDFDQASVNSGGQLGEAFRWRGYVLAVQGQYIQAIRWFERALKANPGNAQAWRNRGVAYLNLAATTPRVRDFACNQALRSFNSAIQLKPNDAQLYYRRGLAYEYLGEYAMAQSSFRTAFKLDPKLDDARQRMAGAVTETSWHAD